MSTHIFSIYTDFLLWKKLSSFFTQLSMSIAGLFSLRYIFVTITTMPKLMDQLFKKTPKIPNIQKCTTMELHLMVDFSPRSHHHHCQLRK